MICVNPGNQHFPGVFYFSIVPQISETDRQRESGQIERDEAEKYTAHAACDVTAAMATVDATDDQNHLRIVVILDVKS